MIKLMQQHHLDSVSCLSNYPNYKDSFINNIYYHYKYLENQSNQNPIFGQIISAKIAPYLGKKQIKPIILHKNLLSQNIPKIISIPNEISFFNYQNFKFDKDYLYEIL